jgi:hypothetical protein
VTVLLAAFLLGACLLGWFLVLQGAGGASDENESAVLWVALCAVLALGVAVLLFWRGTYRDGSYGATAPVGLSHPVMGDGPGDFEDPTAVIDYP